jgi:SAM-dependent methyltransferase
MTKDRIYDHLNLMSIKNSNIGYCPVCNSQTIFVEMDVWLRDYYRCLKCNSIPRERALMRAIDLFLPKWTSMKIHESSPSAKTSKYMGRKCKDYSYSQYFPNIDSGAYHNGTRCENLEKLTFEDGSFDLFITQDVLEHVNRPDKVFSEIARVLNSNGAHVFTVPLYKELEKSRPRIKIENGKISYLFEPVYHGNPIDSKGSLVTWDYGIDISNFIFEHSGMLTNTYSIKDRHYGIDGEFIDVFISKKYSSKI